MFGVVALRGGLVEVAQLEGDDLQLLAFEPADDLADEPPLDAVGLTQDEGAIGHKA